MTRDQNKTKQQLLDELVGLRNRITKLETLEKKYKLAEDKLKANEQRFHSIVETANEAIISVDSHSNIVYWNPAAEFMFGFSADEVIGKPITMVIPDRYHESHRTIEDNLQTLPSSDESNLPGRTIQVVGRRKDGSEFPVEHCLATWETDNDKFFTVLVCDITERKQAEEALKESQSFNSSLLENAPHAVVVMNPDTSIRYVNPAFEEKGGDMQLTIGILVIINMATIFGSLFLGFQLLGNFNPPPELIKVFFSLPLITFGSIFAILLLLVGLKKLNKME